MKKIIFFSLLLTTLVITKTTFAQKQGQALIDSLLAQLPAATEDTNKVNLLVDLSFHIYTINPDDGIKFGKQGLELAEKLNWKKGVANANNRIGVNFGFGKSDYPKALEYFLKSLKINEELGDKKEITRVLGNIGGIYYGQLNYPKALEYYFKSLALNEELVNKIGTARDLGNIGMVYGDQSDYPKALEYSFKALTMYEELGDRNGIAINCGNIGVVYNYQKDYPKALEYYFKSLRIVGEIGNNYLIAKSLGNIGNTYLLIAQDGNKVQLDKFFKGNKTHALQQAKNYTDSAIVIFKTIGDLNSLFQGYQQLSEIQALLGDNKSALESYKNYTIFKDSVFNTENDKKLTQTAMQYEFDKKEAFTQAEQDKKDIRQNYIRNLITAGLASVLIILMVVYRQWNRLGKEKKKSDAEKQRSEELLLNILPSEVAEELKTTGAAKAKSFTMVTVMFTDFKDFTSVSEKVSAELLVDEIHFCFSAFDNIIHKYKIEKIKTIGDAYLCASGVPVSNYTHAVDMVNAAFEIRNFMLARKKEKEANGEIPFELRIGIHTGPVVAGIVGVRKFAYDIWGDTVNLAARMQQNSEPGKINISGSTYELVKNKFTCTHRGKVEAKNKGMVDMYFTEL